MVPHAVRRDIVEAGLVAGALAGTHDFKPAGASPVDDFTDEGRLVSRGHGVDRSGRAVGSSQHRTGQNVSLDIDHDDVFAVFGGGECMSAAGSRRAGDFHHHLDGRVGNHRHAVVCKAGGSNEVVAPADIAAGRTGALDIEVGDCHDAQVGRERDLVQEHGAKLAGTYDTDPDRA